MHEMLDITISVNQETTQLILEMEPGAVFAFNGSIYLKLYGSGVVVVEAVYLGDCSAVLQEIGEAPERHLFTIRSFAVEAYGRVVKKAGLTIEL